MSANRYLVFAGKDYYPSGGAVDFKKGFAIIEEAESFALDLVRATTDDWPDNSDDWAHVFDTWTLTKNNDYSRDDQ